MRNFSTRRALLLSVPAFAALPVAGQIKVNPVDPHPEFMNTWRANRARWRELADLPGNGNWDHPLSLECERIQTDMEQKLASVPATTMAGAIACLSWMEEEMHESEWAFKGHKDAFDIAMRALRAIEADQFHPMHTVYRA